MVDDILQLNVVKVNDKEEDEVVDTNVDLSVAKRWGKIVSELSEKKMVVVAKTKNGYWFTWSFQRSLLVKK